MNENSSCLDFGCLLLCIIILPFCFLFLKCDAEKTEKEEAIYTVLKNKKEKSVNIDSIISYQEQIYNLKQDREELANLIHDLQHCNKYERSLVALNDFHSKFEDLGFVSYNMALTYLAVGKKNDAINILDSLIHKPIILEKPSKVSKIFNWFLDEGNGQFMHNIYLDYAYSIEVFLYSILVRNAISKSKWEKLECLSYIEKNTIELDSIMTELHDYQKSNRKCQDYFYSEKINIQHCFLSFPILNPSNTNRNIVGCYSITDRIYDLKWLIMNLYLNIYDSCYGYKKSAEHFKKILSVHKLYTEAFQHYLIDSYLNLGNKKKAFPSKISYEDFKKFKCDSICYILLAKPTTLFSKANKSEFINKGIYYPTIILKLNDWNFYNNKNIWVTLKEFEHSNKEIFLLNEDYSVRKTNISTKKIGAFLEARPISSLLFEQLKIDFKNTINNE